MPGMTTRPLTSMRSREDIGLQRSNTAATLPSRTAMSKAPSNPCAGSMK